MSSGDVMIIFFFYIKNIFVYKGASISRAWVAWRLLKVRLFSSLAFLRAQHVDSLIE